METIKIRRENIDPMEIDAAIRIKDCSGFFDAKGRRLKALLTVAKSWEVRVPGDSAAELREGNLPHDMGYEESNPSLRFQHRLEDASGTKPGYSI